MSSLVYNRSFTVHSKLLNCALVCIYYVMVSHERFVAVKHGGNLFFVYSMQGMVSNFKYQNEFLHCQNDRHFQPIYIHNHHSFFKVESP